MSYIVGIMPKKGPENRPEYRQLTIENKVSEQEQIKNELWFSQLFSYLKDLRTLILEKLLEDVEIQEVVKSFEKAIEANKLSVEYHDEFKNDSHFVLFRLAQEMNHQNVSPALLKGLNKEASQKLKILEGLNVNRFVEALIQVNVNPSADSPFLSFVSTSDLFKDIDYFTELPKYVRNLEFGLLQSDPSDLIHLIKNTKNYQSKLSVCGLSIILSAPKFQNKKFICVPTVLTETIESAFKDQPELKKIAKTLIEPI